MKIIGAIPDSLIEIRLEQRRRATKNFPEINEKWIKPMVKSSKKKRGKKKGY